jgi:sulfur-carrier protein
VARVIVQYYAQLREQAGGSTEQAETAARDLAALYDELARQHGFSLPREALKVAVNAQFAEWSLAPQEGDVIVFIPPVAGG